MLSSAATKLMLLLGSGIVLGGTAGTGLGILKSKGILGQAQNTERNEEDDYEIKDVKEDDIVWEYFFNDGKDKQECRLNVRPSDGSEGVSEDQEVSECLTNWSKKLKEQSKKYELWLRGRKDKISSTENNSIENWVKEFISGESSSFQLQFENCNKWEDNELEKSKWGVWHCTKTVS
ncbi:hypothetical protein [Mycoplasma suis]|uniref:Uncharacterized protein n=2 Tax=Mycoplasma suis TaxID=57372 RepID=F0QQP2_MYCSL|nr:hypothetical protein [Mycoplasma suis]ADX97812.1 hypothetical protein MSU_0268 [Mycoplasma suis str. Illinois]CBZ40311.1 hypothetical protein MSUIS_02180 [Mycoplasma suis KI3806]